MLLLFTCSSDISTGSLKTTHWTDSVHGGVVLNEIMKIFLVILFIISIDMNELIFLINKKKLYKEPL
jgi:hypothetical protein